MKILSLYQAENTFIQLAKVPETVTIFTYQVDVQPRYNSRTALKILLIFCTRAENIIRKLAKPDF